MPAYDALGNVHAMIKASDGTLSAIYEYDAFGQTLRATGPYAASNPFRFATKYTDTETGLVQYNKRYYSPSLGRFLNRDPLEEDGGLNLYAYCENDPANCYDILGMNPSFRGFGPTTPYISPNQSRVAGYNSGVTTYNTYVVAPANKVISAYNFVLTNVVNPVRTEGYTRTAVGTYQIYEGTRAQIGGAKLAMSGAAGAVTIPGAGQIAGPVAVTAGLLTFAGGTATQGEGFYNFGKGLSGQGFAPLPTVNPISPASYLPLEPGVLKMEPFVVTAPKVKAGEKPPASPTQPTGRPGGGSGGGSSRPSTPGATVITDPGAIADVLSSLGAGAEAAMQAEIRRILEENLQ